MKPISMKIDKTGGWARMKKLMDASPARMQAGIKKALDQEGLYLVGQVKKQIRTGPFEKLAKTTLAMRRAQGFRGTKPLIRTGDMRNSVTHVVKGSKLFIGIPRSAKSRDGKKLFNIADIHENGRTFAMRVTPKMLRFWFAVLFKNEKKKPAGTTMAPGKKIIIIRIPARPFIAPVFAREAKLAPERFLSRLAKNLGFK